MKRTLLTTGAFQRSAKRFVHKKPAALQEIQNALQILQEDAFDQRLKTHKLKGQLAGSWSCSAGYDLRIIFRFVQHGGDEAILLQTVGTHDEVY